MSGEQIPTLVIGTAAIDLDKSIDKEFKKTLRKPVFEIHDLRDYCNAQVRPAVVTLLNKCGDISTVRDLLPADSGLAGYSFSPIYFRARVPLALQTIGARESADEPGVYERSDDFHVVYDGKHVLIAAESASGKDVAGFYDVKERIAQILRELYGDLDVIYPSVTHGRIFINRGGPKQDFVESAAASMSISEPTSTERILGETFLAIEPLLLSLYACSAEVSSMKETSWKLDELQSKLLELMKRMTGASWRHPFQRRDLLRDMRKTYIDIYDHAGKLLSSQAEYREWRAHAMEKGSGKGFSAKILRLRDWTDVLSFEPRPLEIATRTADYGRMELQAERAITSTVRAALIGGVIGSGITLVATYLPQILRTLGI